MQTSTGSGANITSLLALTAGNLAITTVSRIRPTVRLSNLHAAAATITVKIINTTDTTTVYRESVAKDVASNTGMSFVLPSFLTLANKTYSISVLSSNASDTNVSWRIDWEDAGSANQTGDVYAKLPANFEDLAIADTTGKVAATIAAGDNADKSGYSIDGTSGGVGATASVALEDIYATAFKNGAVTLYARVYKNGADIHRADLSTIVYSVYLLDGGDPDERTAVEGRTNVSLAVSGVIFDTLQSDLEASDYNFKHTVPVGTTPAFTIAGRDYLVEYILTPTAGEIIIVRFRIEVK